MDKQEKTVLARIGSRGPAPTGKGHTVGVRLQPDLLGALDAVISDEPDSPSRPEMLRRIAAHYLKDKGYLK